MFWNPRNYCHIICSEGLHSHKIFISCIPLPKVQSIPFCNPKRQGKHLDFWCLGVLELDVSSWVLPGMLFWNFWVAQFLAQRWGWCGGRSTLRWARGATALPGCPLALWSIMVQVNPARNLPVASAELEFHPSVTGAGDMEWCQVTDVELERFLAT